VQGLTSNQNVLAVASITDRHFDDAIDAIDALHKLGQQ